MGMKWSTKQKLRRGCSYFVSRPSLGILFFWSKMKHQTSFSLVFHLLQQTGMPFPLHTSLLPTRCQYHPPSKPAQLLCQEPVTASDYAPAAQMLGGHMFRGNAWLPCHKPAATSEHMPTVVTAGTGKVPPGMNWVNELRTGLFFWWFVVHA